MGGVMAIQIPSSAIALHSNIESKNSELVKPTEPPGVIENLKAIDPRITLRLPTPIGDAESSMMTRDSVQNAVIQNGLLKEPETSKAVLLELSRTILNDTGEIENQKIISKMTAEQSVALNGKDIAMLHSSILAAEDGDTNPKNIGNIYVIWPNKDVANNAVSEDIRGGMAHVLQGLKNSDMFAGEKIQGLLSQIASQNMDDANKVDDNLAKELRLKFEKMGPGSVDMNNAINLILHGQLQWQGELFKNHYATITREDAWRNSEEESNLVEKGTSIKVEMTLPQMGKLVVRGIKFDETINLSIEVEKEAQVTLLGELERLHAQLERAVSTKAEVIIIK